MTILELKKVHTGYVKNDPVIKGVDIRLDQGEVISIVGQNGSGKSTLAKSILNITPYVSGNIFFNNIPLNKKTTSEIANLGISFYMQGGPIFPTLSVEENLKFAGLGLSKKDYNSRMNKIMLYFNIINNAKRNFLNLAASYLSGGEKSQLALALTMIALKNPPLLILDEPTAGLSPKNINHLHGLLKKIIEKEKISVLLIEQNLNFAITLSSRILILKNGVIAKEVETNKKNTEDIISKFIFEGQ